MVITTTSMVFFNCQYGLAILIVPYFNLSRHSYDIISVHQASELTGYAVQTLYGKVSRRDIPFIKKGGKLWFSRDELTAWIKEGKQVSLQQLVNNANLAFAKKRKGVSMSK